MNATVLPAKQEVRRNPKADGDGFMASNCCSVDIVSVFILSGLCFMAGLWVCLTCHCEDLRRRILAHRGG